MHRRQALQHAFSAAALLGWADLKAATPTSLPDSQLYSRDPESYWTRMRAEQFLLQNERVFLNNGSLGVTPKPVIAAIEDYLTRSANLVSDEYHRWGYETLDDYRTEMANFVGCKKDELAFMHNATEALSTVANGLDLKAGDEVVMTDQEHPSGKGAWTMRQARHGIVLREVKIPLPPKNPDQLADLMISAIGPKTKVLSFSGILTTTGLIMPVRKICDAARVKGVLTLVDGAHMNGQTPLRIEDFNCDFYAGSPHKWLFAPAGCGLLYVREENQDRLWPSTTTTSWSDKKLKAAKYMMVGTNNRSLFEGMMAGLRFHQQIGSERIYKRVHDLSKRVYAKAKELPYLDVLSTEDDRMYAALTAIRLKTDKTQSFFALAKKRRIWMSAGADHIRLSTHIHTRPSDIDTFFETLQETVGKSA